MAKDHIWQPGQPHKFIPQGDVAEASKWLGVARRRLAMLAQQGEFVQQQFSPAEGVTIHINTLRDIPRIMIEVGGGLYATGGFNGDGILEIRTASRAHGPYNSKFVFPEYAASEYKGVSHFDTFGNGRFAAMLNSDVPAIEPEQDKLRILLFENSTSVVLTGTVDIASGYPFDATPPYALITNDGIQTILSVDNVEYGAQPRLRRHDWKGALISDVALPLTVSGREIVVVFGIYKVSSQVLLLRGAAISADIGVEPFPFLLRSVDNGATWALVSPTEYPFAPRDEVAFAFGFAPLAQGGVLGTGVIDEDPEFGPPETRSFASTFSSDTGASFGIYTRLGSEFTYIGPARRPVAVGGMAALQHGSTADGHPLFLRTEDGGTTWTPVLPPIFADFSAVSTGAPLVVSVGEASAETVLVMPGRHDGKARAYRSADGGITWTDAGLITDSAPPGSVGWGEIVACGTRSRRLVPNPVIPDLHENAPPIP